ncbi:hypothetical protein BDW59DRAFT_162323 [Aspergillus cavernicola]|uniref:Yeast cell wall synthesis Kre9/Knh1 C-terminal domain-containing protein n=1 Tax=Aspergillus cavernicola TaxID=176166 RepID=A0ABR4IA81_9EURO
MRFIHSLTATLIFLTSTVLADIEPQVPGTDPAFKADNVVTATWDSSSSLAAKLNPRMNNSEDAVGAQKRKVAVDPYMVPYPLQTGPTRYAPLAKKPGTAIATASPTPQFPASPYKVATEYLRPGTVETTLMALETLSVTMMENAAAPAAHPKDS